MRKGALCICENKDADQLRGKREADQRLCFRYIASTIPLLPKYKISSFWPSSVAVQQGLCETWSETPKTGFLTMRLNLCTSSSVRTSSGVQHNPFQWSIFVFFITQTPPCNIQQYFPLQKMLIFR